jgi:hypothetical protein
MSNETPPPVLTEEEANAQIEKLVKIEERFREKHGIPPGAPYVPKPVIPSDDEEE